MQTDHNPPRFRVACSCGYSDDVRSEPVARALEQDHDDTCTGQVSVTELDDE